MSANKMRVVYLDPVNRSVVTGLAAWAALAREMGEGLEGTIPICSCSCREIPGHRDN